MIVGAAGAQFFLETYYTHVCVGFCAMIVGGAGADFFLKTYYTYVLWMFCDDDCWRRRRGFFFRKEVYAHIVYVLRR